MLASALRDEQLATLAELFAGRFTIREKLDWGGLALFYGGTTLRGELAIAVLPLDCESKPENSRLFLRAIGEVKGIEGPGILAVHDAGVQHGVPFVAYDRVAGVPLATVLEAGAMEPRRALTIARKILDALVLVHGAGAFHGDLTPANVLLGDEHVVLVGVGLAAILRAATPSDKTGPTGRGSGKSAIRYLAPEVLGGARGSESADLFSVGALLHHMIGGLPPGKGEPEAGAFERVPGLREVIAQAMERTPAKRFADAQAMKEALALEVLAEVPDAPVPDPEAKSETPLWNVTPPPEPAAEPESSRSRWPLLLALLILAGAGVAAWLVGSGGDPVTQADPTPETAPETETETDPVPDSEDPDPETETETETETDPETDQDPDQDPDPDPDQDQDPDTAPTGLQGPLAAGPLPELLQDVLDRIAAGERFEEPDFQELYQYMAHHRDDVRGELVFGRAFMSRGWHTAAFERYERALRMDESATEDPQVLEDLLHILAHGDDMLFHVWPNIRRYYGTDAMPVVERMLAAEESRSAQRELERLQSRLERL